ncbi:hypothetical protein NDU88_005754 [Pleurodeles waltl]|uniref:Uncharacterized protein n=1 Tax=Pleurodeles waltl TaxID=8319 RepID=A0AAV7NNP9_PLEWA|nr:hypothetical protein NDU88_005754 [Pleurodeles waltl]
MNLDQSGTNGEWCRKFQRPSIPKLPVIPAVHSMLQREWRDPARVSVPCFMARLYPLSQGETSVPQIFTLDPLISKFMGKPSLLSEEVNLSDPVDKKVEAALKRSQAGLSLSLCSENYGVYTSQSLVKDFQSLSSAIQDYEDFSDLLSRMEIQATFLSDISFDSLWASVMATAGSVSACLLHTSFGGSQLFVDELEEVLRKSFKS